eukprot:4865197-Amphidinium_carterae.1
MQRTVCVRKGPARCISAFLIKNRNRDLDVAHNDVRYCLQPQRTEASRENENLNRTKSLARVLDNAFLFGLGCGFLDNGGSFAQQHLARYHSPL